LTSAGNYNRTITNAAGCDSVITLQLNIADPTTASISSSICAGQTYSFGSQVLTNAGTYTRTITNAAGCDSIITLQLSIASPTAASISSSICPGQTYSFGSQSLTNAGTYTLTITNAAGCDSVITLSLSVLQHTSSTQSASICSGQSFIFGSQSLSNPGSYTLTVPNAVGCDSVITLLLSVKPTSVKNVSIGLCSGQSYSFGNQTITNSGTYVNTFSNAQGCDSVVTLNVTVASTITQTVNSTLCQGQTLNFGGQTLSTAGTYSHTYQSAGGCDSTVTLNLTVGQPSASTINVALCQGQTYTFFGQTLNNSGTYTHTLPNDSGCDSVITLTINVNQPQTVNLTASICQGQTYTFDNQTLSTAGTFSKTQTGSNGCDSTTTLTLTIKQTSSYTFDASVCQGQTYTFGNQTLSTAGTYTQTLTNANGCDSLVTLQLSINSPSSASISASICAGQSYAFGSQSLTTAGTFNRTIPNAVGCDSVITLQLSVIQPANSSLSVSICQGQSYTFGSQTLTTAGTYSRTIGSAAGCDSIITLNLTVKQISSSSIQTSICQGQSYTFGNQTITTAGTYSRTISNAAGCDSVITLILTVNQPNGSSLNASICQGQNYTFGSQTLTTAGSYTRTVTNSYGCDSVITLSLTVKPSSTSSINASICQGQSYNFGSQTISNAGTYTRTLTNAAGCDSIITLVLSINANPPKPSIVRSANTLNSSALNGNQWYALGIGAISGANGTSYAPTQPNGGSYFVIVTQNNCTSPSSDTVDFIGTGLTSLVNSSMRAYPNPVDAYVNIELNLEQSTDAYIEMQDLQGRAIKRETIKGLNIGTQNLRLNTDELSEGMYILQMQLGDQRWSTKLIVRH
jgi:hypothetical protein